MEHDHQSRGGAFGAVLYCLQLYRNWPGCQNMQELPLNEGEASRTVLFPVQQQAHLLADGTG